MSKFKPVDSKVNFHDLEEEVLSLWKKEKTFQQSIKNRVGKERLVFYEGPPTANGKPGSHHVLSRSLKDIINRFQTMKGKLVERKGGWDTHGLPVEIEVEKKLGIQGQGKKGILTLKETEEESIKNFNELCRQSVFEYVDLWVKTTKRIGFWIDMDHPYVTMDNSYIESVWNVIKKIDEKGLLYEDYKVVPFCPRCGTPLSSHEVAQGYKDVTEESVYIAFKVKNKEREYFLVWTTTPWTLPGNVALAVGKNIDYVRAQLSDGDIVIVSKDRLSVLRGEYKILETFKGKNLEGVPYEPLYPIKELQNKNSHKVLLADFVTTSDGTGIVHTAGMYGEDDYNLCKKYCLPLVHTVNEEGKFNALLPWYEGRFVKSAENDIKDELQKKNVLYKREKITHAYPFCWRCATPLLYYAITSWFIKVSAIQEKMVALNKQINWEPAHIKEGRFGKWLEGAKDWALSRSKFWGTPLPIWRCECGNEEIIGSVKELKEKSGKLPSEKIDLHKPWIDK